MYSNHRLIQLAIAMQDISGINKLIFIILASYCDRNDICYPSIQKISIKSGVSQSSVIRSLNYLDKNKHIIRLRGRKYNTTTYQLIIIKEKSMKDEESSVTLTHKDNSKVIPYSNNKISSSTIGTEYNFNEFWSIYPKRVDKKKARFAYFKACKVSNPSDINSGAFNFASVMEGKEKRYIPHPTTWLNGERWEDDFDDLREETNTEVLNNILDFPLPIKQLTEER